MSRETRTFELNKLVRDDIVADHKRQGCEVDWRVLQGDELRRAAVAKVREEVGETLADEQISASEFGDSIEVLLNLARIQGISREAIFAAMEDKNSKKGDFSDGHFIATVTVPADSWFAEYYGSDPERFPEVL